MKYKTKYNEEPAIIEAVRYTGLTEDSLDVFDSRPQWLQYALDKQVITNNEDTLHIQTLEGIMEATPGDYIIQSAKWEIYPCKPDIFEMTYETCFDEDKESK